MSTMKPSDPYTRIELAIIARLKAGLGNMVRDVTSYGGEMDDDLGAIVAALPAAWVTFGGIVATKPYSTSREKWLTTGRFAVMAGQRNVRGEAASRMGGGRVQELGTNPMVWAIRRLLIQQDLVEQDAALRISALRPGRVRTLFNTALNNQAVSVFACEFETDWIEKSLPNTRFPVQPAPGAGGGTTIDDPEVPYDTLFGEYAGDRSHANADLLRVRMDYHLRPAGATPDARDEIQFPRNEDGQ